MAIPLTGGSGMLFFLTFLPFLLNAQIPATTPDPDSARIEWERGRAEEQRGHYRLAVEHYLASVSLRDSASDPSGLARVYAQLGQVYRFMGMFEKSLACHRRALNFQQQQSASLALPHHYLGALYAEWGLPDSALPLLQLALAEQTNDPATPPGHRASTLNVLGEVYASLQRYTTARGHFMEVLAMEDVLSNARLLARARLGLARVELGENKAGSALKMAQLGLTLLEQYPKAKIVIDAHWLIQDIYAQLGRHREAWDHLKAWAELNEEQKSTKTTARIVEVEYLYEVAKNQQRIGLLTAQKERKERELVIERQWRYLLYGGGVFLVVVMAVILTLSLRLRRNNRALSGSLRERKLLYRELQHRVKNNLQLISSLVYLQGRRLGDQDHKARSVLEQMKTRIRSMALVHGRLSPEPGHSWINMRAYLPELVEDILLSLSAKGKVTANTDEVEDILLDPDSAIPLGLIINELITNSIKHAFGERREGHIQLSLTRQVSHLLLRVSDDGKWEEGNAENSSSFGLSLVRSLGEKLDANLQRVSGPGTTWELEIEKFRERT